MRGSRETQGPWINQAGRGLFVLALAVAVAACLPFAAGAQQRGETVFSQEEICQEQYQTGLEYLKNNRLRDAADAFTQVKEACPAMVDAYLNLGSIQVQLQQYMEAIDTYEDALDQEPDNLDIKEAMAYALSSAGELDDAVALYLELHQSRPDSPDIMRNLAFVYKQKGLTAEAVMLYNRLIELDLADATMVSEAGRMALEQKLYLPAVTFYKKLYEFDPQNVNTLSILGGYYWKIKFYGEAIPYYDRILELEPDGQNALLYHKILMACHKAIKQYREAAEHGEYVLEKEPNDPANYCNLAFVYKDAGDYDKALATVDRGLQVDANAGCLHYAKGVALEGKATEVERQKRYEEMLPIYEQMKGAFQRVINLGDPRFSGPARQQLERIDALIERVPMLIEKRDMGQ